jgi:hypothetical protein
MNLPTVQLLLFLTNADPSAAPQSLHSPVVPQMVTAQHSSGRKRCPFLTRWSFQWRKCVPLVLI